MPPKPKFSKKQITAAAFDIARESGIEKVTARELGDKLGSSARPIFTVFKNMDDVKSEIVYEAKQLYAEYVDKGLRETPAFKGVGKAYISFAKEEPNLFRMLFMSRSPNESSVDNILPQIDESYERILDSIIQQYSLDRDTADKLYQHLWTYTHGIATICVTGLCAYSDNEISERLTAVFKALIIAAKQGE